MLPYEKIHTYIYICMCALVCSLCLPLQIWIFLKSRSSSGVVQVLSKNIWFSDWSLSRLSLKVSFYQHFLIWVVDNNLFLLKAVMLHFWTSHVAGGILARDPYQERFGQCNWNPMDKRCVVIHFLTTRWLQTSYRLHYQNLHLNITTFLSTVESLIEYAST